MAIRVVEISISEYNDLKNKFNELIKQVKEYRDTLNKSKWLPVYWAFISFINDIIKSLEDIENNLRYHLDILERRKEIVLDKVRIPENILLTLKKSLAGFEKILDDIKKDIMSRGFFELVGALNKAIDLIKVILGKIAKILENIIETAEKATKTISILIPIIIVGALGLGGYFIYRLARRV